jgi:hypothetical protein
MNDPILEAAARALFKRHAVKGGDHFWDDFVPDAEAVAAAVTPLIRAQALEKAAQVAEGYSRWSNDDPYEIAAAIRAMNRVLQHEVNRR